MSLPSEFARVLADGLFTGSVHGALFIAVVWLVCRHIPRIPASVQAGLWWLASLKLLLAMLAVPEVSLPLLPAPERTSPAIAPSVLIQSTVTTSASEPPVSNPWVVLIAAFWLFAVLVLAIRLVLALRDLRAVAGRSIALSEEYSQVVQHAVRVIGLRRVPDIRVSHEIHAPLVAGLWRPIVLIPAHARLDSEELRMALCHELMHVRRRDLALGWVPAIAERLFFFHPLARLTAREYVTAREAACDAAVVRALGVSPDRYGRLLVRLGFARAEAAFAAGGAPGSLSSLRRRLNMLHQPATNTVTRAVSLLLVLVALLVVAPFKLSARPAEAEQPSARAAVAKPAPTPAAQTPPRQEASPKPQPAPAGRATVDPEQLRERETTENFLRDQVAELAAQFEALALAERRVNQQDIERQYRQNLLDAERTMAAVEEAYRRALTNGLNEAHPDWMKARQNLIEAERQLQTQLRAELRVRESDTVETQLRVLHNQQQELLQQMQLIAQQQRALAEAQQRIAAETQRLREALKAR